MLKKKVFGILSLIMGFALVFVFSACGFGGIMISPPYEEPETSITITVVNNTGYDYLSGYIKPATSADWGSSQGYYGLSDGGTRTMKVSLPLSAGGVYDIQLKQGSYNDAKVFTKYGVAIAAGMTFTFTTADVDDESDHPTITIQNRTGVYLSTAYIKPSSSSDWGERLYHSISNNEDREITIHIPPSRYSKFDIRLEGYASNSTVTYTKKDVTVSDGMDLMFTSADADNPTTPIPVITVQNNTDSALGSIYIKPTVSTSWGYSVSSTSLEIGELKKIAFTQPLSAGGVYDIQFKQSSYNGKVFTKWGETITDGMTLNFTADDLDDGSKVPTITIQNRSGVYFDSVHVKPSSSSDWGTSFGTISNNYDSEETIPIPLSRYSEFDIQMKSSNPTNSYTRTNVSITNGMVLTFTSADKDNATIEKPVIVIENKTGEGLSLYMKTPDSTDWDEFYIPNSYLDDGELLAVTLPEHLNVQSEYDIRLSSSYYGDGKAFTKLNVSVSDGMIVTFTADDLEEP